MTTGRINQVTIIHFAPILMAQNATFADGSSSNQFEELIAAQSHNQNHLVPQISQISSTVLLVAQSNKDHGLQRELLTTGLIAKQQPQWIPKWLMATGLAISK